MMEIDITQEVKRDRVIPMIETLELYGIQFTMNTVSDQEFMKFSFKATPYQLFSMGGDYRILCNNLSSNNKNSTNVKRNQNQISKASQGKKR